MPWVSSGSRSGRNGRHDGHVQPSRAFAPAAGFRAGDDRVVGTATGFDWPSEQPYLGLVFSYALSRRWIPRVEPTFGLNGLSDRFAMRMGRDVFDG
jgi:hypothetical protein